MRDDAARRRIANIAFYLGIALLMTHELDAMTHHEWRLLPGLALLNDTAGRVGFLWLHVPLFAVIVGLVSSLNRRVRHTARLIVAAFLIVHAGLHLGFSGHELYTFHGLTSRLLIFGAAVCGFLYCLLAWRRYPDT